MPGAMKAPWQWGDGMELQFHDVAKRYGAKEALRGIDLTLTAGGNHAPALRAQITRQNF